MLCLVDCCRLALPPAVPSVTSASCLPRVSHPWTARAGCWWELPQAHARETRSALRAWWRREWMLSSWTHHRETQHTRLRCAGGLAMCFARTLCCYVMGIGAAMSACCSRSERVAVCACTWKVLRCPDFQNHCMSARSQADPTDLQASTSIKFGIPPRGWCGATVCFCCALLLPLPPLLSFLHTSRC